MSPAGPVPAGRTSPQPVPADPETPFGLYVHFPFCPARCPYCAFYFVVGRENVRDRYIGALVEEIARRSGEPPFAGRRVRTIYFGGGTPSLMSAESVGRVIEAIRAGFPVEDGAEVSLESNPDGLTEESLRGLREAGVNRLTIGWQSLDPASLRGLGRTHGPDEARASLPMARAAGLENVAVDLMFGLPGQSPGSWAREVEEVAALGPDHVSAYELTMEEGTRFFRKSEAGELVVPGEDVRARMFQETETVLAAAGIARYEISNFAAPGKECRHNLDGWRSGDLLGVGASAASHVTNSRWKNVADLDGYVERVERGESPGEEPEVLDAVTWAAEDLYLGLRTVEGVDAAKRLDTVPSPGRERLRGVLDRAIADRLLEETAGRTRLTGHGRLLADSVFEELLTVEAKR